MTCLRPRARSPLLLGAAVALLLLAHAACFTSYVRREIAGAYPPNFDQTTSLWLAYRTYEEGRAGRTLPAVGFVLLRAPNGAAIVMEAVLLFAVVGPSRLAALFVNWLHFALFAGALAGALWTTQRRVALSLLAVGLLWTLNLPFYWAGGMADFRPDFAIFCLYGTFLAAVWQSRVFRRRAWSAVAGVVGAGCVLTRPFTAVSLGGLLAGTLVVLVSGLRRGDEPSRAGRRQQAKGVLLAATTLALAVLPVLALQAGSIWAHYVAGYFSRQGSGVWLIRKDLLTYLFYYPRSALLDHGGPLFLAAVAASLAALAIGAAVGGGRQPADPRPEPGALAFMAAALVLPLLVLTAYPVTSPLVGGVLMAPLLWVVLTACSRLAAACPAPYVRLAAVGVLGAGVGWQAVRLASPGPHLVPADAVAEVARLHDAVLAIAEARGQTELTLVADRLQDYLPAIRVCAYERHGRLINVHRLLEVVGRPVEADVWREVERSDLVVVTDPKGARPPHYPYDEAMTELHPRLLDACQRTRVLVGRFRVPDTVLLFARPPQRER